MLNNVKTLFDGRLNVTGFVNYRKADLVPYDSRSTSACYLQEAGQDGPLSCAVYRLDQTPCSPHIAYTRCARTA